MRELWKAAAESEPPQANASLLLPALLAKKEKDGPEMMKLKIIKNNGEVEELNDVEKFVIVAPSLIRTFGHYSNGDRAEYKYDFATAEIVEAKQTEKSQ